MTDRSHELRPQPKSRFVKIQCNECKSENVAFTAAKSQINCKFCGGVLAMPSGGRAKLFGTIMQTLQDNH